MRAVVPRRWLILLAVMLAFLPVVIDMTILHIAVPSLTLALGASATEVLWIIDIYPLLMAGLLERADVVVVDAPPVLQGDGPGLISTLPGIAVMAVAARRTGQRDAVSSANVLRESGVRLTGYVYASLVAGSSFPRSARARVRSLRRSLPAFIHNLFS